MTWGWFIVGLTALAGFEASTRGDFLMGIQWVNHSLGFVSEWRYRPISQWNYGHSKGNMMEKWIWGVTNLWTNQNSGCLSEKERAFNVQTMDVIWAHLSCKKKVSRPVGSTHPSVNKWQFTLKGGEKKVRMMRIQYVNVYEACEFFSTQTQQLLVNLEIYENISCLAVTSTSRVCIVSADLLTFTLTSNLRYLLKLFNGCCGWCCDFLAREDSCWYFLTMFALQFQTLISNPQAVSHCQSAELNERLLKLRALHWTPLHQVVFHCHLGVRLIDPTRRMKCC